MYKSSDLSFYLISLGCSKNLVDSEKINGQMISAGFTPAESSESSNILIINTCGFIRDAKEEAIDVILDAVSLKESHDFPVSHESPNINHTGIFYKKVAVTGCLSARYYSEIENDIPEIDFLYGIPDDNFVKEMCRRFKIKTGGIRIVREKLFNNYPYSYIKISDGCSNNCSYCAIPLIRGPHVSFSPEIILQDAKSEVERGALELNIIAQDIAVYKYGEIKLPALVNEISKLDKLRWIRLLYCHPDHITDDIINLIAENEKVVPYIDIPFQHVNRSILKSMGRKGSSDVYMNLISELRAKIPGLTIRSTFMVGYPGEGDREFRELISFVKFAELDRVGCFTYSPEEGTAAYTISDNVDVDLKKERLDELMSLQMDISKKLLKKRKGQIVDVLVEEKIDDKTSLGRTKSDAPEVDGVFYLTSEVNTVNTIVKARVTGSDEYDLKGVMV